MEQVRPLATDVERDQEPSMKSVRGVSAMRALHVDRTDSIVPAKLTDAETELLISLDAASIS